MTPSRARVMSVGEHERDVEQGAAGDVDQDAEAPLAACPLADDRADHRERDAHPHPAEDRRQRGRHLHPPDDLPARGPERVGHLEQARIDRPDPDHRRDRHREEHDQRRDDELAREPDAEPQHDERRQREDRGRLGGDEVRAEELLREPRAREEHADDEGERAPIAKPRSTSTSVVEKCGHIVPSVQAVDEPLRDDERRREDERRVVADDRRSPATPARTPRG